MGFLAAGGAVLGLFRIGPGWDAGIDTLAAQQVESISAGASLEASYEQVYSTSEFYGVFVQASGAWLYSLFFDSADGYATSDLMTYRFQGFVVLAVSFIAAMAFGWALGVALQSRLVGGFSFAALMTWPLFFGMSFVNFKDMPVAGGLTLFTSGLILCWCSRALGSQLLIGLLSSCVGAIVTLSTRIGAWPLLCAIAVFSLLFLAVMGIKQRRWSSFSFILIGCASSAVASGVALLVTNPLARLSMPHWLVDSYLVSKNFPVTGTVRLGGLEVDITDLPLTYVPQYFLAQAPLLSIIWGATAVVLIVISLTTSHRRLWWGYIISLSPVLFQGFGLVAIIVVSGSVLYDGVRHLIFAIPALVAILALGVRYLELRAETGCGSWWRPVALLVPVLVVVGALFADLRWFPYSYAFVNPIAGRNAEHRDWELDFWGLSTLEAVDRLRASGLDQVVLLPEPPLQGVSEVAGLLRIGDPRLGESDFGVFQIQRGSASLPWPGCQQLFSIDRDGHPLGIGFSCPPAAH